MRPIELTTEARDVIARIRTDVFDIAAPKP